MFFKNSFFLKSFIEKYKNSKRNKIAKKAILKFI